MTALLQTPVEAVSPPDSGNSSQSKPPRSGRLFLCPQDGRKGAVMGVTLGSRAVLGADLVIVAGASNLRVVRYMHRTGEGREPVDLTGWTALCQIRRDGRLLLDLSDWVRVDSTGLVTLDPPPDRTRGLEDWSGSWDLVLTSPQGRVVRLCAGSVSIIHLTSSKEGTREA